MDQTKNEGGAPGFAQEKPAPEMVKDMPGMKGSTDPATDGGGNRGNNLRDLERTIGIK